MKEMDFKYEDRASTLVVTQTSMSRMLEIAPPRDYEERAELNFLEDRFAKIDQVKRTIRTDSEGTIAFIEPHYKEITA